MVSNSERDYEKVSFTVLRNNLATYLEKLAAGVEVEVRDARRRKVLVILKGEKLIKKKWPL